MRLRLLLCLLGFCCLESRGDEPPTQRPLQATTENRQAEVSSERPMSVWMEKKLEYSQEILRGLVTADLERVSRKAEQMRLLSKVEGWVRKGSPGYTAQLKAFDFANQEIQRNARAGRISGATLAFQQLTTSCVSCHTMIRDQR